MRDGISAQRITDHYLRSSPRRPESSGEAQGAGYFFIFPALVILRRKYPDAERPYRVPGGQAGAWLTVIITEAFVVLTTVTLLWPGAINAVFGQSYSIQSSWGVSRVFFESVTLGSLGVMITLGLVFWGLGERRRRAGLLAITVTVPGPAGDEPTRQ
jgi:hypothetical protein